MKAPWRRGPSKLDPVLGAVRLDEATGRAEMAIPPEATEAGPARIHNPKNGTRSHYRDPSGPDLKPVCGASGAHWDEGDGGLQVCGLCPHMWAQRQGGSEEKAAAS